MPVTFHREDWTTYYSSPEREALWQEHYNEFSAVHLEKLPMSPDLRLYEAADKSGILEVVSARQSGKLVGYCLLFIRRHMHYNALCAFEDSYFLTKSERKGIVGYRLIKKALQVSAIRGCRRAFFMTKVLEGPDVPPSIVPIFQMLGMERMDETWAAWL